MSGAAGSGKTELVLRLLAENPAVRVAWVEEDFTIYPCAFPRSRVGLDRVLFVESEGKTLWTAQQILRSQLFGAVVIRGARAYDEMELRRLQIQAEKAQASVILIADEPSRRGSAWPISVQLKASRSIEAGGGIHLSVLKYGGRRSWEVNVG